MNTNYTTASESFVRLLHIMDELREKCPWDKKQTFETLRNLTIEECYELADAILEQKNDEIKKELGDVLLHIVFYSKIASETAGFSITDVINSLCEKLIYRHPHVFGDESLENQEQVKERWEQLKLQEKGRPKSVLGGVPNSLPAIVKAARMQQKARAVGFDWECKEHVWDKVEEELAELKHELKADNHEKIEEEVGDFLFAMVNTARLYGIDAETALEKTNKKFKRRFEYLESKTIAQGKDLRAMTLQEMDEYWNKAKKIERTSKQ
ncbi:MAG: nucleoside triphosphate pyrophosphohydrolase [Bacteroidales bacterium]|jgi:XTP/dITP diphosphohydrolase|nr:nucleoside triphosphate pyrophosphohydrolase [Bacteroidales bacterium]